FQRPQQPRCDWCKPGYTEATRCLKKCDRRRKKPQPSVERGCNSTQQLRGRDIAPIAYEPDVMATLPVEHGRDRSHCVSSVQHAQAVLASSDRQRPAQIHMLEKTEHVRTHTRTIATRASEYRRRQSAFTGYACERPPRLQFTDSVRVDRLRF